MYNSPLLDLFRGYRLAGEYHSSILFLKASFHFVWPNTSQMCWPLWLFSEAINMLSASCPEECALGNSVNGLGGSLRGWCSFGIDARYSVRCGEEISEILCCILWNWIVVFWCIASFSEDGIESVQATMKWSKWSKAALAIWPHSALSCSSPSWNRLWPGAVECLKASEN